MLAGRPLPLHISPSPTRDGVRLDRLPRLRLRQFATLTHRTDADLDNADHLDPALFCRDEMLSASRILRITPSQYVRKTRDIQIPPGKHDLQ